MWYLYLHFHSVWYLLRGEHIQAVGYTEELVLIFIHQTTYRPLKIMLVKKQRNLRLIIYKLIHPFIHTEMFYEFIS